MTEAGGSGPAGGGVKVALYPLQCRARAWLSVIQGEQRKAFLELRGQIASAVGTPQAQVDWSDPDKWVPEKTTGEAQALALRLWKGSGGIVNPRHLTGPWRLASHYMLLEPDGETLRLTPAGLDFVSSPIGPVARHVDEGEGLLEILGLVAERGPGARSVFRDRWREYLIRHSNFRAEAVVKDTLSRRLRDLVDRGFLTRHGQMYSITDSGLAYLQEAGPEPETIDAIRKLIGHARNEAIAGLQSALQQMDPIRFETLIKRLLEEMGYANVEVTPASGDGGVDVIGEIELGITAVREVVQVKRKKGSIQRHALDALRGSLHRFRAVRGTIITTGDFTRGTREAAFESGAAPITLINGDKLVELLIEHELGVRRRSMEVLELDLASLEEDPDAEESGER